jgi:Ca2+-transporting ATPase
MYLANFFKTVPITLYELGMSIALSSIVFWAVEIEKWIKQMKKSKTIYLLRNIITNTERQEN